VNQLVDVGPACHIYLPPFTSPDPFRRRQIRANIGKLWPLLALLSPTSNTNTSSSIDGPKSLNRCPWTNPSHARSRQTIVHRCSLQLYPTLLLLPRVCLVVLLHAGSRTSSMATHGHRWRNAAPAVVVALVADVVELH
jgi:hypothetical protein